MRSQRRVSKAGARGTLVTNTLRHRNFVIATLILRFSPNKKRYIFDFTLILSIVKIEGNEGFMYNVHETQVQYSVFQKANAYWMTFVVKKII